MRDTLFTNLFFATGITFDFCEAIFSFYDLLDLIFQQTQLPYNQSQEPHSLCTFLLCSAKTFMPHWKLHNIKHMLQIDVQIRDVTNYPLRIH